MKIFLTKLEIPQLIQTSEGYLVLHLSDNILSLFEFSTYEEAEKSYQQAISFYQIMQNKALQQKDKTE